MAFFDRFSSMKRSSLLGAALCLLFSLPAAAGEPSPSVGIPVPDASITTQSDSASLEVNPAGLGYLHGFELAYGLFRPAGDYEGTILSGHAFTLGAGGEGGGFGLGVQWMDNPRLGAGRASFLKYTLGGALSPSPYVSFGGNVNFFSSRTDERLNDLRTIDLGLQLRPNRYFGVGLMGRDVRPAFLDADRSLPMRIGLGFVLRFFNGRLVFDTEAHTAHRADDFQVQPRLAVEPYSGIRFFGRGSFDVPRPFVDSTAEAGFDELSVGLELSLTGAGVSFAHFSRPAVNGDDIDTVGAAGRVRVGTPQQRSLFPMGQRWVRLRLDQTITEQATVRLFGPTTRPFLGLINDLDAIAVDPAVTGVVLEVGAFNLGFAQLWELQQAFERLHEAGKNSIAIVGSPTTRAVYAASAAEQVWMSPTTPYSPTGLQVEFASYAGLLENLGIEAEFLRIGDYKSAPESYVMPGPSDPALEQTSEYLDALYAELTERIATRRGLSGDDIRDIIDNTPLMPADALDRGLVDALVYNDEIEARLEELLGISAQLSRGYERFDIADERWGGRPEIAVVYIDGAIIDGQSGASPLGGSAITGAETILRVLRQLRTDRSVKAVVVRINSPGGSALGSDLIFRELRNLATEKPVVASMSNVAASGGYYIAAGADEIFATPVSLTGSIGIFAGKFNIASLAERFDINIRAEGRGDRAGVFSVWRPWTESERQGVAQTLEYLYQLFLQQISVTRPLSVDEVDDVARGRVWTGEAALGHQLVDQIGGISDALRRAEELAGLEPGQAVYVDRTGAGGSTTSPAVTTRFMRILRHIGLLSEDPLAIPDGEIPGALRQMERSILVPLYYESGEALFLPPFSISME